MLRECGEGAIASSHLRACNAHGGFRTPKRERTGRRCYALDNRGDPAHFMVAGLHGVACRCIDPRAAGDRASRDRNQPHHR